MIPQNDSLDSNHDLEATGWAPRLLHDYDLVRKRQYITTTTDSTLFRPEINF